MSGHLRSGVQRTAAPTPAELELAYRLQGQQRRFSYLLLPVSGVKDQVKVTDTDIQKFYVAHGHEYMTTERVKVEYLELEAAKLELGSEPDEAALRALYDEDVERFITGEERHARHILVLIKGTGEENIRQAASKADEVIKRLDAGDAFDVLAREVSEDPGSASSGGECRGFDPLSTHQGSWSGSSAG